jgi:tryptophan synthase alpha chain
MNRIDEVFEKLRSARRKAFIPFLTAGDPDASATPRLAAALIDAGADLLEVGFPYSDPIADGPVIQASYTRALERGLRLDDVFRCARAIADARPNVPLVGMTSFSLVHRRGPARFIEQAREAGLSGAIVPDLPVEESLGLAEAAKARDFKLIQLVTPTTPRARAKEIVDRSTGFVYSVSVAGITGERKALPAELLDQLAWLRTQTKLPVCVGFGVSTAEHVRTLRDHADGVIVGSALVRLLEQGGSVEAMADRLAGLTRSLAGALTGGAVELH